MRVVRLLLGALGVAVAAYGAKLLLDLGFANTRATLTWVIGGVLVHDVVLAPVTVLLGAALVRWVKPGRALAAVLIAGVVTATVTVAAIPVLGRWGAREDNATLLDRNYVVGWVVFVAITALVTLVAVTARGRQRP